MTKFLAKKKLIISIMCVVIISAGALFSCASVFQGQAQEMPKGFICPNGEICNIDYLYESIIPRDFPKELFPIICCTFMYTGLIPVHGIKDCYIGVTSYSGTPTDDRGWTLIFLAGKYVAVIEYTKATNLHKSIWISQTATRQVKKYIKETLKEVNSRAGNIMSF